jgi:NMD protein affecting ribosome stability and mRNA decay
MVDYLTTCPRCGEQYAERFEDMVDNLDRMCDRCYEQRLIALNIGTLALPVGD